MSAVRKIDVRNWASTPTEARYSVAITCGDTPVAGIRSVDVTRIQAEETVMEWSGADHIHGWFVENIQGGVDDNEEHFVPWDRLRQLLSICIGVLSATTLRDEDDYDDGPRTIEDTTVARALLPIKDNTSSCDYNEYYLDEVRDTHSWISRMLTDGENGTPGDIYYSSSD